MDERRTGWVLLFVLAGQLVVLAIQAARTPGESRLEAVGLRVLGPVARAIAGMPQSVSEAGEGMKLRGQLVEENRELRREVEELRLKLLRLTDIEGEMRRLGSAVRYPAPPAGRIRAVDIVYIDHASWLRTLVLYSGGEPAQVNQPVLSHEGLVGRVVSTAGPYAKAQLITDGAASVGGMILRTRRQGVVRGGRRSGGVLELDYVPLQADVRPGDRVVTAGIDGVYPRGIPIGTVVEVSQGGQLFHRIQLAPAVDFGLLDQVYLLEYESVPKEMKEVAPGARP
ncbi:MAG TPA: rod shape-determining protein MreC [Thermoanaerobaculia bacterium]|nr:rod shape-determining protein MreC [Thermoanaerobaculia bacterium]